MAKDILHLKMKIGNIAVAFSTLGVLSFFMVHNLQPFIDPLFFIIIYFLGIIGGIICFFGSIMKKDTMGVYGGILAIFGMILLGFFPFNVFLHL